MFKRVEELGYYIKISESAKKYIAQKGFDPKFGARPLKRAIQKYIEDFLAETIIKAKIAEGDTISVGFKSDSGIQIKILKKQIKKT